MFTRAANRLGVVPKPHYARPLRGGSGRDAFQRSIFMPLRIAPYNQFPDASFSSFQKVISFSSLMPLYHNVTFFDVFVAQPGKP